MNNRNFKKERYIRRTYRTRFARINRRGRKRRMRHRYLFTKIPLGQLYIQVNIPTND